MPEVIRKVLLECQDGRSNKFYEVRMERETSEYYTIIGRYGSRKIKDYRHKGGSEHKKGSSIYFNKAENLFWSVLYSKLDKGYKKVEIEERKTPQKEEEEDTQKSPSLARFSMLDI